MKILSIIILITVSVTPVFAANCRDDPNPNTQFMVGCAYSNYHAADAELNRVYNKILVLVKNDIVAKNKIIEAQRAWLKFRDAQVEMYYPPRRAGYYGTFNRACVGMMFEQLTHERIRQLKQWLKTPEEGDMCARNLFKNEKYA